ncbi:DUF4352 domain-containing protein [Fictibacillus enclensis]|uniref:DUF4352 domain-containing protein n=1 Tax=Fictibacillus enclensis TaxID=1017270 RepID=UPI0024BFB266|nr:DUF4352 domain-containing protein [Fictibacillus enclensis]WHY74588.1 DUF4352 domain-containing protein [Fictibacillus enclensis]
MAKKEKVKKPIFKRVWFWVLVIFVVIIAANMGGGDDSASTSGTTETASAKPAEKKEVKKAPAKKSFAVGQDVKVGKFTYKVLGVNETNKLTSPLGNKTTEGKYTVVELSIKNGDKKARMADSNMFKIKTADDTEYEADAELDMYVNDGDIGFFLQDINPNLTKKGKVVFELPTEAKKYNLEVSSGFGWSGGEYKQIKLK